MYSDYCSPPSSPSSSPLSLFMQLYIFLTHTQGESIKTKLESIICKQKASKEKKCSKVYKSTIMFGVGHLLLGMEPSLQCG